MKHSQVRHNTLWGIWFFWILALLFWIYQQQLMGMVAGACSVMTLVIYIVRSIKQGSADTLFNLRSKMDVPEVNSGSDVAAIHTQEVQPSSSGEIRETVIAENCLFTGDISVGRGVVRVYGEVSGNIRVNDGTVEIMQGARTEGDIFAPFIRINGNVDGVAEGGNIEILASGVLKGYRRSVLFSIREGGVFVGQSEQTVAEEQQGLLTAMETRDEDFPHE